jgi:hypothetical protein
MKFPVAEFMALRINRDSSLTTQRSVDSAIHERVVAQQELEHQNFRGSRQRRRVLHF